MTKADFSRSIELFQAFRLEKVDPDRFYRLLALDSIQQVSAHLQLKGKLVFDVGGGAGYFTNAFREAGARCVLVEPELLNGAPHEESDVREGNDVGFDSVAVSTGDNAPWGAVVADGNLLPFADRTADVCFSSNVLEHVPDPERFISEMIRVTKPGGIIYVAYTNWFSPWGGHGTSPWHYFGGEWALDRFKRVNGREPINRFGETLFAVHVGTILNWVRARSDIDVLEAAPRYYPAWCDWIVNVPGVRELATWNLMLVMRREV
jgi:SAM-dependent methyltransferase